MMDHALFYCVPDSGHHLDFLTDSSETTSLDAMRGKSEELWSSDLYDDVMRCIGRIKDSGSDILAVDQTAPEQLQRGLYTYKVLIPGAVPMTWGEHLRRLEGLPRLERALRENASGNSSRCLPNAAPHPYP
jgi:ribosomal protein S12 methylthiotransferase accessory factor